MLKFWKKPLSKKISLGEFYYLEDNENISEFLLFPYKEDFKNVTSLDLYFNNLPWMAYFTKIEKYGSFIKILDPLNNGVNQYQIRFIDNYFKKGPELSNHKQEINLKDFKGVQVYTMPLTLEQVLGLLK